MRRMIVTLVGCVLGATVAVLSAGRVADLRAVAPSLLPTWAAVIEGESTLWRGRTSELRTAVLPVGVVLSWRFGRIDTEGAHWDVSVSGPGLSGTAAVTVPYSRAHLAIRAGRIEALVADWPALIDGWPQRGMLSVSGLRTDLQPPLWLPLPLSASVEWSNAGLGEVGLGRGEGGVMAEAGGQWRAPFSLEGGMVTASGRLTGQTGTPIAQLDLGIAPGDDMPQDWREALDQVGTVQRDGTWQISRQVALDAGWPLF